MKMRPTIEYLENRINSAYINMSSNMLIVAGDNRSELLYVDTSYGKVNAVIVNILTSQIEVQQSFCAYDITDLIMIGGEGNDIIINRLDYIFGDIMIGNGGNDVLIGSKGHDKIIGSNGNDVIFGNGGDDFIYGNGGNDFISANDEAFIDGGSGSDYALTTNESDCLSCTKKVVKESEMNKINESNMMSNISFTTQQKKDYSFFLKNRQKATNIVDTL